MKPQNNINKLEWVKLYLTIFLPFAAIFAAASIAHYYTITQTERVTREFNELLNIGLARSVLNSDLSNVVSDLLFLSTYIEKQGFDTSGQLDKRPIAELFYAFAREKHLYDQIRFLDSSGMEEIRINYKNSSPEQVKDSQLQNKSSRYYFTEAMQLPAGEPYISPLDLNIEQEKIEQPLKPVMRFAVVVRGPDKNKHGLLVLNYLGSRLLGNFARASANIAEHTHLLNANGYWLHSPQQDDDWGFMLNHGKRFSNRYPEAWKLISAGISGQFRTTEGLFTFETVTPWVVATQASENHKLAKQPVPVSASRWKVVSRVPPGQEQPAIATFVKQHMPLYLSISLLLLTGSWLLTQTHFRHRRAERLREYERQFRQTLEDMQLATITVDRDFKLVFCNDYCLRLTGWKREEIIGCNWIDIFISDEQKNLVQQAFDNMDSDTDFPHQVETMIRLRNGDHRLIAWHNTPSINEQGKVVGITAVGEDITEQSIAQEKVKKLSRAVEQSPSMVLLTDRHGCIEYVNPKFTEVTGYTLSEIIGQKTNILKSGETGPEAYKELWDTVLAGKEWRGEFHNRRKNGELYYEAASISSLRDSNGEITNFVAVKEDITERKRLEAEVELHNRELAHNQALTAIGRMSSMIAHDLRNPLSSVKMGMQILGKHASSEDRELAKIGLDQIRHMENILTDMLSYAKPEAVKSDWVNIVKLIEITISSLRQRIENACVAITTDFAPGLPLVLGDTSKLRQLFANLIVNALDATEKTAQGQAHIHIEAQQHIGKTGAAIRILICDNGCGLDQADGDRLFEPFYTTRTRGTGLGLAIVQQIVSHHYGSASLNTNEDGGVCAEVILPTNPVETD